MKKAFDVEKILNCLAEALGDCEGQTLEEIRKDIEEEGVDYKAASDRLLKEVERQGKVLAQEGLMRLLDLAHDDNIAMSFKEDRHTDMVRITLSWDVPRNHLREVDQFHENLAMIRVFLLKQKRNEGNHD